MKKRGLLVFLLLITLLVTGCQKKEDKVLNCSLKGTIVNGVQTDSNYKVTYDGDYVQIIETEEIITSDSKTYLETVKSAVESMYSPYKDVEHYDYNVKIDGNTLISTTKINYAKIDVEELFKVNSAIATILEDGKLKVEDIKNLYKGMGIVCE